MLLLPADIITLLAPFAPVFSRRVWRHIPVLVAGAILAPGRRMVSSALRVVGLSHVRTFQTYHRVLNRAVWSSLQASGILLRLLVTTFAANGHWCSALTRRSSADVASRSRSPESTAIRCAPATATSSR
jgi:DDE superfamily endonuclease